MNSNLIQRSSSQGARPSQRLVSPRLNLMRYPAPRANTVDNPFQVADSYTEKVIVGTLLAAKYVNYLNPLFWPFLAAGCGGEDNQNNPDASTDASSQQNPCAEVDCDGHGRCAVAQEGAALCFCDEGYTNADDTHCIEDRPTVIGGDGSSECLDTRTAAMTTLGGETYIAECGPGSYCENGVCKTMPGETDPNCNTVSKISQCIVTDVFDVGEKIDHEFERGSDCGFVEQYCTEDDGFLLFDSCWIATSLAVYPPPSASYYRLDAKADVLAGRYDNPFKIKIFFGDDQFTIFQQDENFQECIFQPIGFFGPFGITENKVRVNFEEMNNSGRNLAITKLRIWSCTCD